MNKHIKSKSLWRLDELPKDLPKSCITEVEPMGQASPDGLVLKRLIKDEGGREYTITSFFWRKPVIESANPDRFRPMQEDHKPVIFLGIVSENERDATRPAWIPHGTATLLSDTENNIIGVETAGNILMKAA